MAVPTPRAPPSCHAWQVSALVGALARFKQRAPLCERGLAALGNVMLRGGSSAVGAALRHDAMTVIADVMAAHPKRAPLLVQACYCCLNAAAASVAAKQRLVHHSHISGAERLLAALFAHPTNLLVAEAVSTHALPFLSAHAAAHPVPV